MIFASLGRMSKLILLSLIAKIIRFAHDFCFARQNEQAHSSLAIAKIENCS
jgi:hypothetical protein